jgi:uncharacterized protein YqfA (UPF0365 family)
MFGTIKAVVAFRRSGVRIGWTQMLGFHLRRSLSPSLVQAIIAAHKENLNWSTDELEAHSLAGGDPLAVVSADLTLREEGIRFDHGRLSALDLGGYALPDLVSALLQLRHTYPALTADEFFGRAVKGEDVLADVRAGQFVPLSTRAQ